MITLNLAYNDVEISIGYELYWNKDDTEQYPSYYFWHSADGLCREGYQCESEAFTAAIRDIDKLCNDIGYNYLALEPVWLQPLFGIVSEF